jgi:hypothetical protein
VNLLGRRVRLRRLRRIRGAGSNCFPWTTWLKEASGQGIAPLASTRPMMIAAPTLAGAGIVGGRVQTAGFPGCTGSCAPVNY